MRAATSTFRMHLFFPLSPINADPWFQAPVTQGMRFAEFLLAYHSSIPPVTDKSKTRLMRMIRKADPVLPPKEGVSLEKNEPTNPVLKCYRRNIKQMVLRRFTWDRLLCVILVAWAVGLHVYRFLNAGALWRDEISSLDVAASPTWTEFYLGQSHDSFPLFNVLLLRIWLFLGHGSLAEAATSDTYLRLFGMLGGLTLVGSLVWVASRTFRSLPILSIALSAASPSVVLWGDSIRAYALGATLSVLFFGSMWNLIREPNKKIYAACVALAVLMVWTLYGNAFFVLSICLAAGAVAATRRDLRLLGVIMSIGFISALSLSLNYPILSEMTKYKDSVAQYITSGLIADNWWAAWSESSIWIGLFWISAILIGVVFATIKIFKQTLNLPFSQDAEHYIYAALTILLSLAGFIYYLKAVDIPPQSWYFIPIGALTAIAIDSLWPLLGNRNRVFFAQTSIAFVLLATTVKSTLNTLESKLTNLDTVAIQLDKKVNANDMILISPIYQACTFIRYYKGQATVQVWPPHKPDQLTYQRGDVMWDAIHSEKEAILPLWDEMGKTLRSGGKVWIAGDIVVVPADRPPPWVKPGTLFPGQSLVGPYLYTWGAQVFYFLANHAKSASVTDKFDITQVNRWEAIQQVVVFEGWNEPAK